MKSVLAASLLLGLVPFHGANAPVAQDPGAAPLESSLVPNVGRVSVSAGEGPSLTVEIESDGKVREQRIELNSLPNDARVRAAKAGPWMQQGFVIVIAVEEGDSTAYHYMLSGEGSTRAAALHTSNLEGTRWGFSKEIFRSTGEPYRIVEANRPGQGDGLEITFRRSRPSIHPDKAQLDEKILLDNCGGIGWPEALQPGRAVLYEVSSVRTAR